MRPAMLNSDNSPANAAAIVATRARCSSSSCASRAGMPMSWPPNTSCSIGDAIPMTPMPALTLRHSTPHKSQNCGVRIASFASQCAEVTSALGLRLAKARGAQSRGGNR